MRHRRSAGSTDVLDGAVRLFGRGFAWAGGGLMLLVALLVAGDVVARNLTGRVVFHAFELSTYLFAAATAFGFAHTLAVGGNIRLDVLYGRLPLPARRALDLVALAVMAGMGGLLAGHAWRLALANQARGVTSATGLAIPLAWPQGVWAVGLSAFALTAAWLTLRHGLALRRGDGVAADAIGAIRFAEGDGGATRSEPGRVQT